MTLVHKIEQYANLVFLQDALLAQELVDLLAPRDHLGVVVGRVDLLQNFVVPDVLVDVFEAVGRVLHLPAELPQHLHARELGLGHVGAHHGEDGPGLEVPLPGSVVVYRPFPSTAYRPQVVHHLVYFIWSYALANLGTQHKFA